MTRGKKTEEPPYRNTQELGTKVGGSRKDWAEVAGLCPIWTGLGSMQPRLTQVGNEKKQFFLLLGAIGDWKET